MGARSVRYPLAYRKGCSTPATDPQNKQRHPTTGPDRSPNVIEAEPNGPDFRLQRPETTSYRDWMNPNVGGIARKRSLDSASTGMSPSSFRITPTRMCHPTLRSRIPRERSGQPEGASLGETEPRTQ